MKEYIIAILFLALVATGTLLSLQTLTQKATATPRARAGKYPLDKYG